MQSSNVCHDPYMHVVYWKPHWWQQYYCERALNFTWKSQIEIVFVKHFIVCHMPTWIFCAFSYIWSRRQQICLDRILWIFCVEIVERTINEHLARFWNQSLPLAATCEPDDLYMRFKMSASERRLRLKWGLRLPFVSFKMLFHWK